MPRSTAWWVFGLALLCILASVEAANSTEISALNLLYEATGGPTWIDSSNWLQGDPCTGNWFGVTCEYDHVTNLRLSTNNLTGSLPDVFLDLPSLEDLYFPSNPLVGSLPASLYQLALLQNLDFSFTSLSGPLSASIGNLRSLRFLGLRSTEVEGSLPSELRSLSQLKALDVSFTNMDGSFPLLDMSSLAFIYMDGCEFHGSLDWICTMPSLQKVEAAHNFFEGSIPSCIGSLNLLQSVAFGDNSLSGSIPDVFQNLTQLEEVVFYGNSKIQTTIPSSLAACQALTTLLLQNTLLYGPVPLGLWNLTRLTICDFSGPSTAVPCPVPDQCCSTCIFDGRWCGAGFYCPAQNESYPCDPGYYCPQGIKEEVLCDQGYYCSTPVERLPCPPGQFCLNGTVEPLDCLGFGVDWWCTGSADHSPLLIIVFGGIFLISLAVFSCIAIKRRAPKRSWNRHIVPALLLVGFPKLDEPERNQSEKRSGVRQDFAAIPPTSVFFDNPNGFQRKIQYSLAPKQVLAVMGPSGSGKSQLFKATLGILPGEKDIYQNGNLVPSSSIRQDVAYVPQYNEALPAHLLVWEYVMMRARDKPYPGTKRSQVADDVYYWAAELHLDRRLLASRISELSGGEQKRVFLLGEVIWKPKLIFLDEPTSGLDERSALELLRCMHVLSRQNISIVAILHVPPAEALEEGYIDKFLFLQKIDNQYSRSVFFGTYETLGERIGVVTGAEVQNPISKMMEWLDGGQGRQALDQMCATHAEDVQRPQYLGTGRGAAGRQGFWRSLLLVFIIHPFVEFIRVQTCQIRDLRGFLQHYVCHLVSGLVIGAASVSSQFIGPMPAKLQSYCPAMIRQICALPVSDPLPLQGLIFMLGVSLPAVAMAVHTFSGREWVIIEYDLSVLSPFDRMKRKFSVFVGRALADVFFRSILGASIVLACWYPFAIVTGDIWQLWALAVLVELTSYAWGHCVAVCFLQGNTTLYGITVVFTMGILSGISPTLLWIEQNAGSLARALMSISYLRWALEAFYLIQTDYWEEQNVFDLQPGLDRYGYEGNLGACFLGVCLNLVIIELLALVIFCFNKTSSCTLPRPKRARNSERQPIVQ